MQAYPLPQATRPALNLEFCALLGKVPHDSLEWIAAHHLGADYMATMHAGVSADLPPDYSVTVAEDPALRQTVYELHVYDTSMQDYAYLISVRFTAPEANSRDPVVGAMTFDKRYSDGRNRR